MPGPLFGYKNAVDTAALSAGSEAGSMRSYNLADPVVQKKWRALGSSSFFLAQFLNVSDVAFLVLAGATLGAADTIRHRLYDVSNIAVVDITVPAGVVAGYGLHFLRLDTPAIGITKWQCDIDAPSRSAAGYFEIGRAVCGPSFEPKNGISEGFGFGSTDEGDAGKSKYSGITFPGPGAQRRFREFDLDFMDEDDAAACEAMMMACGTRNQVFFTPFYDADPARQGIFGKFVNQQPITESNKTAPPTYSQKFRIEEEL